jgi:exopolysaccharide production protein ExoQ
MSDFALRQSGADSFFGTTHDTGAVPPPILVWLVTVVSVAGIFLTNKLGFIGALAYVALWPLLAFRYSRVSLAALTATPIIWLYPAFVVASALWSNARTESLRYGLEHVITVAGAVLAARLQSPRSLFSALTVCMVLMSAGCLAFGTYAVDPLTGASDFVGLFGSKNQVGLMASLMLLASVALLMDGRTGWIVRGVCLVAIAADGPLLYLSKSGTSLVTTAFALMVLVANLVVSRIETRMRARLLFCLAFSFLPAVALAGVAGDAAQDFIVNVMGKDTTLTGRTVLWAHAISLMPDHPLLGVGAGAFWVQDTVEAEGLWHAFHVLARAGFHFHDLYIECAIELGFIGCALLIAVVLSTFGRCLRWSWSHGTVMSSLVVSIIACMIVRSFVEVDMLAPFQVGTFLLFASAAYGLRPPRADGAPA